MNLSSIPSPLRSRCLPRFVDLLFRPTFQIRENWSYFAARRQQSLKNASPPRVAKRYALRHPTRSRSGRRNRYGLRSGGRSCAQRRHPLAALRRARRLVGTAARLHTFGIGSREPAARPGVCPGRPPGCVETRHGIWEPAIAGRGSGRCRRRGCARYQTEQRRRRTNRGHLRVLV